MIYILAGIFAVLVVILIDIREIRIGINKTPMGISQWKQHGIKYGYWEHFQVSTKDTNEKK